MDFIKDHIALQRQRGAVCHLQRTHRIVSRAHIIDRAVIGGNEQRGSKLRQHIVAANHDLAVRYQCAAIL